VELTQTSANIGMSNWHRTGLETRNGFRQAVDTVVRG
jgi:hypothetical protein